jgi:hypothetical protein
VGSASHGMPKPSDALRSQPEPLAGRRSTALTTVTVVCTAYATPPFLTVFHPPIELAGARPRGRLHLDQRIEFSAICCGTLLQLGVAEIHI